MWRGWSVRRITVAITNRISINEWINSDKQRISTHFYSNKHHALRLRDTSRMCVQCRAHNRLEMYCEQLARTALRYTNFLVRFRSSQARFHSDLGSKVISSTFSRDWRELFSISVAVSKILRFKHARLRFWKWDRGRFLTFFDNQNEYSKKLSSVPRQCLCGEYTTKTGLTDSHNFKKHTAEIWTVYQLYLCACVK